MERRFLPSAGLQNLFWKLGLILGCASLLMVGGVQANDSGAEWTTTQNSSYAVRHLASLSFPHASSTKDVDDILQAYPTYLRFVRAVGNRVSPKTTRLLIKKYNALKKRDPRRAALFLKGLRFEMEQYRLLKGASRRQLHSSAPTVRRWVKKYIRDWYREADEHLFRAYVKRLIVKAD